jgi:tripartite-type tricarboxylate transporter receptor subunit TctC
MIRLIGRRAAIGTLAASAVAAPALALHVWADRPYPAGRTVRIVVPFAAGGTTDILGRVVAQILAEATGTSFVVENRTGGGGNVSAEIVAKSAPDGMTLLLGTVGTAVTNRFFYKYLSYDSMGSFAPVALVGELANVIAVHPTFPARTLAELVDYCRTRGPYKVSYASPGVGSSGHLAMEYLQSLAGIQLEHVVPGGRSRMMRDLLAGRTLVVMDNLPPYLPHIQAGTLRALGVTSAERWFAAPDVPTVAEQLGADFHATLWWYVAAPAGTRLTVVNRLSDEIVKGMASETVARRIRGAGARERAGNAGVLASHAAAEGAKWKTVVDVARLKPQ